MSPSRLPRAGRSPRAPRPPRPSRQATGQPSYSPAPGSGLIHARLLGPYIYDPPHNVIGQKGRAKGKVIRTRGYRYAKELAGIFNGGILVQDVEELKGVLRKVGELIDGENLRLEGMRQAEDSGSKDC